MIATARHTPLSVGRYLSVALISWVSALLLPGCQHASDRARQTDSLTIQQLAGTYLVTEVDPIGRGQVLLWPRGTDSAFKIYANSLEYTFLSFSPDGSWWQVTNEGLQEGRYVLSTDRLKTETDDFYDVRLGKQLLALSVQRPLNGQSVECRLRAYRLNFSIDDLRFSALAKATFRHPTRPETDAQIRERVKNSLYFYSLFFRTIYTNQFNRFKPAAIRIPIRFARVGIRIVYRFDPTANWTTLYATTSDAKKAYDLFRKAQRAAGTYPAGETMIHKFSLTLQKMGDAL